MSKSRNRKTTQKRAAIKAPTSEETANEAELSAIETEVEATDEKLSEVAADLQFEELKADYLGPAEPEKIVEPPVTRRPPAKRKASAKGPRVSKAMMDHQPGKKYKLPRKDTERAMVLALMTDPPWKTPAEIAAIMKARNGRFDEKYVYAHAYCTFRDCGIGYETVDGKLKALFPKD